MKARVRVMVVSFFYSTGPCKKVASFPGLPCFLFSIIHGGGSARKTGKAWEHLSRE